MDGAYTCGTSEKNLAVDRMYPTTVSVIEGRRGVGKYVPFEVGVTHRFTRDGNNTRCEAGREDHSVVIRRYALQRSVGALAGPLGPGRGCGEEREGSGTSRGEYARLQELTTIHRVDATTPTKSYPVETLGKEGHYPIERLLCRVTGGIGAFFCQHAVSVFW